MKNKILALVAIVILVGIIVIAILGYNVDYCYKNHTLVSVEIGNEFDIGDIKNITNEVFPNENVEIQSSGIYNDNLILKVNGISEKQKQKLSEKLKEKYGTEIPTENIKVKYIPSYRLRDIVKNYILPMVIAAVIALVYMLIRYKKAGIKNVLIQTILYSIIAEAFYASIIGVTRFPVNRLVMPGAVTIFFTVITFLCYGFEKKLKIEKK